MAGLSGHVKLPHVWVNNIPRFRGLQGSSMAKFLSYASQASGKYLEFAESMVDWYAINSGNCAGAWDTTTHIYLDQASSQVTKSLMRLLGEGPPTSGSTSSTVRELYNWSCIDSCLGAPRTLGRRPENSMNSPRTIRSWRAAGTLRAWAEREVVAGWSKNCAAAPVFSVPVPSCDGDTDVPDRLARRGATLSARAEVPAFCTSSEISLLRSGSSRSSADALRVRIGSAGGTTVVLLLALRFRDPDIVRKIAAKKFTKKFDKQAYSHGNKAVMKDDDGAMPFMAWFTIPLPKQVKFAKIKQ